MSLYGQYVLERTNNEILETDQGFATFRYVPYKDSKAVYIEDIYVVPEARRSHVAAQMADSICAIAKEKGCVKMIGSVVPMAKGSTTSLKVLLAYGMSLESSNEHIIYLIKDI